MRNVWLISCSFFLIFFGFGTAQQYLVVVFNGQGRGYLALTSLFLIYGAFTITGVFVAKLVPHLGGLKHSLLIGTCTYALFIASVALGNTPFLLLASVLGGIGAGLLWVSSAQVIADSSTTRTAGRNFALQTAFHNAGNIAGIVAGGYFVDALSTSGMYLALAAAVLIGLIVLLWVEPVREEVERRPFKVFFIFDRRMLALFPLFFGFNFLVGQAFTAMNVVIVTFLGLGAIPLVISIFRIGNIAGSLSIGTISDRFSKLPVILFLISVGLAGIFLFTATDTLSPLLAGVVLMGIAMSALLPVCLAWLKERLQSEEYLQAFGIAYAYGNIGVLAAITANLYLPPHASFIPAIIAYLLALPGVFLFRSFTEKSHQ